MITNPHRVGWRRIWPYLLVGMPVIILAVLVAVSAVNVPFWDQWELVPFIEKMQHGTLTIADLFAQHNEHRIFFPRGIMLGLAALTQWNIFFELATNIAIALGTFTVLALIIKATFVARRLRLAALFLVSIILFSPAQLENWLWGWQIQWFLNVCGLALAVWALGVWKARPLYKVGVAAIGVIVATFSLASGLLAWVVCVLLFYQKQLRPFLAFWLVAAITSAALYYYGYISPDHGAAISFISHMADYGLYVVNYLALPVAWHIKLAFVVGIAYISQGITLAWLGYRTLGKSWWRPLTPWFCFAAYGILAAFATALSRLPFGPSQGYSSRYQTIACLVTVALVVAVLKWWEVSTGRLRQWAAISLVILVVLVTGNYAKGAVQLYNRHTPLVQTQQCAIMAHSIEDPCLTLLYPDPKVLWPRLEYLRHMHWGGL